MTKGSLPSDSVGETLDYYDQHADHFVERTASISMDHLYAPFLALVGASGRILDAGCGSGRDAAVFAARGYRVTAFDGSPEMARLASERTGLPVLTMTFDAVNWKNEFDAIWACASLLHLPSALLSKALEALVRALRPGGTIFVSMKEGEFQGKREHRWFTDMTSSALRDLLTSNGFEVVSLWATDDTSPGVRTRWINALARRAAPQQDQ